MYVNVPKRLSRLAAQYRRNRARARRPASSRARTGSAAAPRSPVPPFRGRDATKHPPASPAAAHNDNAHPVCTWGSRTDNDNTADLGGSSGQRPRLPPTRTTQDREQTLHRVQFVSRHGRPPRPAESGVPISVPRPYFAREGHQVSRECRPRWSVRTTVLSRGAPHWGGFCPSGPNELCC